MAAIDPDSPLVLTHGNGEQEKVIHYHRLPDGVVVVTSIGNAYTVQVGDEYGHAEFFAVVPDRVDPSDRAEVVRWWVFKKSYDKWRKERME